MNDLAIMSLIEQRDFMNERVNYRTIRFSTKVFRPVFTGSK